MHVPAALVFQLLPKRKDNDKPYSNMLTNYFHDFTNFYVRSDAVEV